MRTGLWSKRSQVSPGSVAREQTAPTVPPVAIAEPAHVNAPATRDQAHAKDKDATLVVMHEEEVRVAIRIETDLGLTNEESLVQIFDLLQRECLPAFDQGTVRLVAVIDRQKLVSHFHESVTIFGQLTVDDRTLFRDGDILCHPGIDIAIAEGETLLETACCFDPVGLVNKDTGLYDFKEGSDFFAPVNRLFAQEQTKILHPFFGVTAGGFFKKVNESCEILVSNCHDQLHDFTEHVIHGQIVLCFGGFATAFKAHKSAKSYGKSYLYAKLTNNLLKFKVLLLFILYHVL